MKSQEVVGLDSMPNWCVEFSYRVHEGEKICVIISKANSFNNNVTISVDNGGFMKTLGNINADNVSKVDSTTWSLKEGNCPRGF